MKKKFWTGLPSAIAATAVLAAAVGCQESLAIKTLIKERVEAGTVERAFEVNAAVGGIVSPSGVQYARYGEPTTISAYPIDNSGYIFSNWVVISGSAVFDNESDPTTTVTITSEGVEVRADFLGPAIRNWNAIASDSIGQRLIAAPYSGYLYSSQDYGATWLVLRNSPSTYWTSVASDNTGRYISATVFSGSIYTSSDFGTTWIERNAGLPTSANWRTIASDNTGQRLVAAVSGGTIYTSSNYGAAWVARSSGLPATATWSAVASDGTGQYLAAAISGASGRVYSSADYGQNWEMLVNAADGATASWSSITLNSIVDDSRPYYAASVSNGNIWTHHFSGHLWWTDCGTTKNWTSIKNSSTGEYLAATASGDTIYTASGYGSVWTPRSTGLPANAQWECIASSNSGQCLAAGVYGGHIYVSTNQGSTWSLGL